MARNKGSLSLRYELDPSGLTVASVIYRGPGGKRHIVRPVIVSQDKEARVGEVQALVDSAYRNVVLPGQTRG